jgi:hypothetical protein
MNSEVAPMIWSRLTSDGMLAASAGAKSCPTELNRKVMKIRGHACCPTTGSTSTSGMSRIRPPRMALVAIIRVRLSWRSAYTPAGALRKTDGSV